MRAVRRAVWVALVAGLVAGPAARPLASGTDDAAGVVQIKRPNLVVADLDRALSVYRDILGFSVFAITESREDSYSYPVFRFPREARLRMATLSTATAVRTLALTELRGVPLPTAPHPHRQAVVIEVRGIERLAARLEAAGLKLVPATRSRTPEGQEFIEQAFEDHDGHLIVLYELR